MIDVVAFGASAGGSEPLFEIIKTLPENFPVPILVVKHLSCSFPTELPWLLQQKASLPAKLAEDGESLRGGSIFLAPPGKHLLVGPTGVAQLSDSAKVLFSRPAVDPLFLSLAIHYRERVLAVILSGRGQDGATGIRAVKGMSGVTLAQTPATCRHSGMPEAAIETGCVDFVLPPPKIASALIALVMHKGSLAWFRSPATVG